MTKLKVILATVLIAYAFSTVAAEIKLTHNNMTLNANLELAPDKTLQHGIVMMTHGTLAHYGMEIMQTLQSLLSERGYNSLSITLSLGINDRHGFYECADPHNHRHTDALDEISAWVNWLKEKGAKKIILLGHSRGGNQTAWFAAEHPDPLIKALVMVAPALWDEDYAASDYKKRYNKTLHQVYNKAEQLVKQGKGDSWMEHTDFLYCKDTKVTARTFVSYYDPDPRKNTPNLLPKITKPQLIFAGSEDTTVKDVDKKVAPLANGKNIKLVVIEGADHFFRDLYAEDIADAVDEFISNL